MPTRRRFPARRLMTAALFGVAVLALAGCRNSFEVESASNTLTLPCGSSGTSVAANWFFPVDAEPAGLIWMQHGFARNKDVVADLSAAFARRGYVVVAPTLGSFSGCAINTPEMRAAVAEAVLDTGPTSALQQSADTAATSLGRTPAPLPDRFVLSGHSAGGALATAAAGIVASDPDPAQRERLAGVVLLDPVENGSAMTDALATLDDVAVLTVSAPPDSCNAQASGTAVLLTERTGFVGVTLSTGCHCDAEGATTNFLCTFTCGTPSTDNANLLKTMAADWADDMLRGERVNDTYYPEGTGLAALATEGLVDILVAAP